jgi:hypothetical protein
LTNPIDVIFPGSTHRTVGGLAAVVARACRLGAMSWRVERIDGFVDTLDRDVGAFDGATSLNASSTAAVDWVRSASRTHGRPTVPSSHSEWSASQPKTG